jgi:gliding motility-associated protein GldM
MGATNCPETPRQRMIGMMYLVLTAMLALNVSKDILDAFNLVDETMTKSNISLTQANNVKYNAIESDTTANGKAAQAKAKQLQKLTNDMVLYIDNLRMDLVKYVDGAEKVQEGLAETKTTILPVEKIEGKDNFDKSTFFLLEEKIGGKTRATALKEKVEEYKANILKLLPTKKKNGKDTGQVDPEVYKKAAAAIGLSMENFRKKDGTVEDWENHTFNHLITAGTVIIFAKMSGEVRNAESAILQEILNGIDAKELSFDKAEGRAIPKSQIVFTGGKYESDIVVAAFNSTEPIDVYYMMGRDTMTPAEIGSAQHITGVGTAKLELSAGGTGEQKFAGLIKVKGTDGEDKYFPFHDTYQVIQPSATIAADNMNVLYAGIPNPVSVSGSVDVKRLSVSIPGCQLKPTGAGKYDVTIPTGLIGKTVTASVTAKNDGGAKNMGNTVFRVKKVPDPTSYLGANIWGGKRTKSELNANPFITARMGDDFVYNLKWTVQSYRVTFITKGIEGAPKVCSGGGFSADVKSAINTATTGTIIIFSDIKVSSIAGQRTLRDITIRIK